MDELTNRAMTAYYRERRGDYSPDQPSNTSGLRVIGGKEYVVLENVRGPMVVYRVRLDGKLKQLRRWPAGIGNSAAELAPAGEISRSRPMDVPGRIGSIEDSRPVDPRLVREAAADLDAILARHAERQP